MNATETENLKIVRNVLLGGAADQVPMDTWISPSAALHYPGAPVIPWAGEWRGVAGMNDFLKSFGEHVETIEMKTESIDAVGERVFVLGYTLGKVRSTGKQYRSDWCLVWEFHEGRCISMREYQDTQAIAAAVR